MYILYIKNSDWYLERVKNHMSYLDKDEGLSLNFKTCQIWLDM